MMESNEEEGADREPQRRFGVGIPSAEVPEPASTVGPDRRREPAAKASRRPSTFACAMGHAWPRATSADLDHELDDLVDAHRPSGGNADFDVRGAAPRFEPDDLDGLLGFFFEEESQRAAREHWVSSTEPEGSACAAGPGFGTEGPGSEVEAVLFRPHLSVSLGAVSQRLLELLQTGRPVVVLSDPTLPVLAEAAVNGILDAFPDAPLRLLHEDGLEVLRRAAALPHLALDILDPEGGLKPYTASLSKIRGGLVEEQAAQAAAETAARERDGWFGTGVVAAPLAPLWVRSEAPAPWQVPAGADPVEAAEDIVERAFGPRVLGGFAAGAVSRVVIPRRLFSRVTEELLARLGDVEEDPRFDPPGWVLDAADPSEVLPRAKRLGLDEGATLIFERRAAREDRKAYGMVFTNGEPRMRTSDGGRAFGVLLLMRG